MPVTLAYRLTSLSDMYGFLVMRSFTVLYLVLKIHLDCILLCMCVCHHVGVCVCMSGAVGVQRLEMSESLELGFQQL